MESILDNIKQIDLRKNIINIITKVQFLGSYKTQLDIQKSTLYHRAILPIYLRYVEYEKNDLHAAIENISKIDNIQKELLVNKLMKEIKLYDTYYKYFDIIEGYYKTIRLNEQKIEELSKQFSLSVFDDISKLQTENDALRELIKQQENERRQFEKDYFNKFNDINKDLRDKQTYLKNPSTDPQLKVDLKRLIEYYTNEKDKLLNQYDKDLRYN